MKAVLAYSGGLDTSCAIAWLKEDYGFDAVVGRARRRGPGSRLGAGVRGAATLAGADDVILLDRKDDFAEQVVAKALLANADVRGQLSARLGAHKRRDERVLALVHRVFASSACDDLLGELVLLVEQDDVVRAAA